MSGYYHKFGINDVFYNRIKAHPQNEFFIWNSNIYYNNKFEESGSFTGSVPCVPSGFVNLFEMNVDRIPTAPVASVSDTGARVTGLIYPYIVKTSDMIRLSTITDADFHHSYSYGDNITGSYPMSASIGRGYFSDGLSGSSLHGLTGSALKNTFDYYRKISPLYAYSSSVLSLYKEKDAACLMTIPSIFYGSSIKKGTVDLKFYITGTLIGRLQDIRRNGELVQTEQSGAATYSGSVAGMVLYNEGFIYLSGAWNIADALPAYTFDASSAPKWIHFGAGANDGLGPVASRSSASFSVAFSGTNYTPSVTMMAHANKGELNHSNNFSYMKYGQTSSLSPYTGSTVYVERDVAIKNVVSSSYPDPTGSFQKTTYISKIGIYDDDKNLIAIASLAKPVKKTEDRDLTFKLKLDI